MLNYKGLKGTYERLIVSEASVDRQMNTLLEQHTRIIPITSRASEPGDELILDYAGFCDGVQFEGGTAQNQSLVLGSGTFIPGFEEQLVGLRPGDEADVRVTFPIPYHAEALAGKDAVFKCSIKAVQQREKYAPNDAFAREVGGFDSFEAMRDALKQGMQAYADQQADADLKLQLLNSLVEAYDGTIDDAQLDAALEAEMQSLRAQLARQGLTLEAYCRFTDKAEDRLRQDRLPDARKRVIRQQVLLEIIEAEGIEASEDDVASEIQKLCRQNNMTPEQLSARLDDAAQRAIMQNVLADKALECLRQYAEIETVERQEG
jgi:trigger factor